MRIRMNGNKGFSDTHWLERLAQRVAEERTEPFAITAGITTSGPAHLGTIGEFLYSGIVRDMLAAGGRSATFHFIGDILDAFDSIPADMAVYEGALRAQLGKPLCRVADPMGCHGSFGAHYLAQVEDAISLLGVNAAVVTVDRLYADGAFDAYAELYLRNEETVKRIVAETSLRQMESMSAWSPIMPICGNCGRIATTRVTGHDGLSYSYTDDRDVGYTSGCGFSGANALSDHLYKLQWRLHWPSWQAHFNSCLEGSGVDHMTKGGSASTAIAIHRRVLHTEPPILYKYGFVMLHGQKYSKSKGIGVTAPELVRLMPPALVRYVLIQPYAEQNKEIDPTGDRLIALYNEVERINAMDDTVSRADAKKRRALRIAAGGALRWRAHFVDMLLLYQIYRDWNTVGARLGDPEGVRYLSQYIGHWLATGLEPERYNFTIRPTKIGEPRHAVEAFAARLSESLSEEDLHNLVYAVAAEEGVDPGVLFKQLYTALIGKDNGPRMGRLLASLGAKRVGEILAYALG